MAKKKGGSGVAALTKARPSLRVQPHHRNTTESTDSHGAAYDEWLSALHKQLESIQSGRILRVDLSTDKPPAVAAQPSAAPIPSIPRYTVTIIDHSPSAQLSPATAAGSSSVSCGVLILSQGRELDWLFSHAEGQQSLCRQQSFHRLLLVALNRGHSFTSLQQVQDEVRESVSGLLPAKDRRGAVPYLALSADIGVRREVAVLPTDANGEVVVEDVREADGTWLRRLLFVNIGMVQSEARLVTNGRGSKSSSALPPLSAPIDFAYLPSGYHQAFLAALSLLPSTPSSMLLVGVGAGSLAMFLSCVLPLCSLTLIELDGAILRAAESFFGFHPSKRMTVRIMDGVEYITATAAANTVDDAGVYDVVCVDCNSGDLSEGLSFPPAAFLSAAALSATHKLCRPSSLFLLNFGCRLAGKRQSVLHTLLDRWDELYEVDVGEADITNTVLAARRTDTASTVSAAVTAGACKARVLNKRRAAEWRQQAQEQDEQLTPFEWDEQMDLTDRCSSMQRISRQPTTQHADSGEVGTEDAAAARWQLIIKPLPHGEDEGATEGEVESQADAEAEEKGDGAEPSAAERKRLKARAKRARQKANAKAQ